MTETRDLPTEDRYLIFQALSHPTRVKILSLLEVGSLTFSELKRQLGMESPGQLQHHLQKLSGLITVKETGSYNLTWTGIRALEIYRESEKSGRPLRDLCCTPLPSELARDYQISRTGTLLRLSIGSFLSVLTAAMIGNYLFFGNENLKLAAGSFYVSLWLGDAIFFAFFGDFISHRGSDGISWM